MLPLNNLSGDPTQDYFADGMTEALIGNLAPISALRVVSRTSAMRFKGTRTSLIEIARELKVDAIIEGSVQRTGNHVRISVQLIHAPTDTHLWAREYERELTDVLKLQGEVARAVADEMRIQVTAGERARMASAGTVDPTAYQEYLLGQHHLETDGGRPGKGNRSLRAGDTPRCRIRRGICRAVPRLVVEGGVGRENVQGNRVTITSRGATGVDPRAQTC